MKKKAKVLELAINRTFWNMCGHRGHPNVLTCSPRDCGGTTFTVLKSKGGGKISLQCSKCGGVYAANEWSAK